MFAQIFGRDIVDFEKNKDIYFACGITEIIHNGSLIADDIEDKSLKRRGQPCTYIKYGTDYAVNTGSLMYFMTLPKVPKFVKD